MKCPAQSAGRQEALVAALFSMLLASCRGSALPPCRDKNKKEMLRISFLFLNTDYNLDTPTEAVQQAVHIVTLIVFTGDFSLIKFIRLLNEEIMIHFYTIKLCPPSHCRRCFVYVIYVCPFKRKQEW